MRSLVAAALYGTCIYLNIEPSGEFIIGDPEDDAGSTGRNFDNGTSVSWGAIGNPGITATSLDCGIDGTMDADMAVSILIIGSINAVTVDDLTARLNLWFAVAVQASSTMGVPSKAEVPDAMLVTAEARYTRRSRRLSP